MTDRDRSDVSGRISSTRTASAVELRCFKIKQFNISSNKKTFVRLWFQTLEYAVGLRFKYVLKLVRVCTCNHFLKYASETFQFDDFEKVNCVTLLFRICSVCLSQMDIIEAMKIVNNNSICCLGVAFLESVVLFARSHHMMIDVGSPHRGCFRSSSRRVQCLTRWTVTSWCPCTFWLVPAEVPTCTGYRSLDTHLRKPFHEPQVQYSTTVAWF